MNVELEEIKTLLPHRKPFLFIDRCEIIEVDPEGCTYKIVVMILSHPFTFVNVSI